MQPTLKDLAKACGVTAMTVLNILNDHEGEGGSETRKRILAAVDELGYRPIRLTTIKVQYQVKISTGLTDVFSLGLLTLTIKGYS
ncbi:helix-turn-helix domain-containing protein [Pararhizobium sp. IMCC21322]|uniref:helix-turn-helix domain-containing protein n=1 Tax=Pararhizobium sp. IMCC21322 TaxID=3067903 RepID=UPI0027423A25|nr:helix-turn-helix domain-containing protein [Pararhizobium sp. IMCC21322]